MWLSTTRHKAKPMTMPLTDDYIKVEREVLRHVFKQMIHVRVCYRLSFVGGGASTTERAERSPAVRV